LLKPLDLVEDGEPLVIERHGRPVADPVEVLSLHLRGAGPNTPFRQNAPMMMQVIAAGSGVNERGQGFAAGNPAAAS
jgi:antitoxin (DNA-binding transcriptional repressor) of toxin-antitoxin stability system